MNDVCKLATFGWVIVWNLSVCATNRGCLELAEIALQEEGRSDMRSVSDGELDQTLGSSWSMKSTEGVSWFLPGVLARVDSRVTPQKPVAASSSGILVNSEVVEKWLNNSCKELLCSGITVFSMQMDEDSACAYCDIAAIKKRVLALVRLVGDLYKDDQAIAIMNHPNIGTMLGCFLLAHYSALGAVLENCEHVSTVARRDLVRHIAIKLGEVDEPCDVQVLEELMNDYEFMRAILAIRNPDVVERACEEFPLSYEDLFGDYEPSPKDTSGCRCRLAMLQDKVMVGELPR